jgi:FtsZ-interacting cell division protein YlmF
VFGSKCYITNNNENLGKYDDRVGEGIFLGYATNTKGYRYFNKQLHKLVDCIHLKVDGVPEREVINIEPTTEDIAEMKYEHVQESDGEETPRQEDSGQQSTSNPSSIITQKNHPKSEIIGEKDKGVQPRRRIIKDTKQSHMAFISMVEPKDFNEASEDVNWLKSMNEELDQIEKNDTWELVPRPTNNNVI